MDLEPSAEIKVNELFLVEAFNNRERNVDTNWPEGERH